MVSANVNNTSVLVATTTTTLRAAGPFNVTIASNYGLSDVWISIGDSARVGQGIRLGSMMNATSATTSRFMVDAESKLFDTWNAVAETTTTTVAMFYR